MKRNKLLEKWVLGVSVMTLIVLVIIMILKVSDMQGDARVINYAGRARGATQRLIKQEMAGNENDELIETLDAILEELLTGKGNNSLGLLKNYDYQNKLKEQIKLWEDLKKEIYNSRQEVGNHQELYNISEIYYDLADDTVDAAEIYSAKSAESLKTLEIIIVIISLVIFLNIILIVYDSIYLIRMNKNLNEIAYIDVLTGLPNRTYCEIKIKEVGVLKKGLQVYSFMFDLNNLKSTNDILGHTAGDKLISSFAYILRASAPERMFIGRFGGDEFIGILYNTTEKEVQSFIRKLLYNINKHNIENDSMLISFAYGYALSSTIDDMTIRTLLTQADKEMYKHKAKIKNINSFV